MYKEVMFVKRCMVCDDEFEINQHQKTKKYCEECGINVRRELDIRMKAERKAKKVEKEDKKKLKKAKQPEFVDKECKQCEAKITVRYTSVRIYCRDCCRARRVNFRFS